MKKILLKKDGVSFAELLIASAIALIVIGGILALSQFAHYYWKAERVKSNVMGKLQMSMERLQKEIRLTDMHRVVYYPQNSATYTAISFPCAVDDNGDGFIEVSGDPLRIVWDKTIIYHVYTNTVTNKIELRRTIFDSFDQSALNRQAQLDSVVVNGKPIATTLGYGSWNEDAGTKIVCGSDSVIFTIIPSIREFDGYSSSTTRSENVMLGSISIDDGAHYIGFSVTGKNQLSTGYRLGVDSFSIAPSGCEKEAEEATVHSSDAGRNVTDEDMSAYGSWSGNRHVEYQASGINDQISLDFEYDQWQETNFATCSPYNTFIEYDNRTGDADERSGSSNYVARLSGFGDSWIAADQTGAASKSIESVSVSDAAGFVVRNVIQSEHVNIEGRAVKITFDNTSGEAVTIDYANIMSEVSGPNGDAATAKTITFNNGAGSVAISAGSSVISDWIDINNFDKNKDYLVTFHTPFSVGSHSMSGWTAGDGSVYSYTVSGPVSVAQDATWKDGETPRYGYVMKDVIYALDLIKVSYFSNGTLTSQIYDTGVDDPAYSTISWNIAKNNYGDYETLGLGANLIIRVRSDDSKDTLKATNDWTGTVAVNTKSASSSSASISGVGSGRYVQFQAEFSSQPTAGNSDYTKSCILKNLGISWPGQSRIVDVSGYFTRRPDYGIFSVNIDGHQLTKGLEFTLSITEKLTSAKAVTRYLTVEAEPRNTGK